jgi:alpha-tubulin suppressor-like RCC1 family protein
VGDDFFGWAAVSPQVISGMESGMAQIAVGGSHMCAAPSNSGARCWGSNWSGQLGDGSDESSVEPVTVVNLTEQVVDLAAGFGHTCALTVGGQVKCWGANDRGQLGTGNTLPSLTPQTVSALPQNIQAITAGGEFTCALTGSGGLLCWGANDQGQLGNGTYQDSSLPVEALNLSSGVSSISASDYHICASLTSGQVYCWGDNWIGQLGDGTTTDRNQPVQVYGISSNALTVAAGSSHSCVALQDGSVLCWGNDESGQLGDGTVIQYATPVDVLSLESNVSSVALGYSHSCALTLSGAVYCWGLNRYGQLGDGTLTDRATPGPVNGLSGGVNTITSGWDFTCALTSAHGVKCWGNNQYGQLGDGSFINRLEPVDVQGLQSGVLKVAANRVNTCALLQSGGMKCWGNNDFGQLGIGTTTPSPVPVDVQGLDSGVADIAVGHLYTCAVMTDRTAKCWGLNWMGQLGDGTTEDRSVPTNVTVVSGEISQLDTGGDHTCALQTDGNMTCWGRSDRGQLGDDSLDQLVSVIELGENYSCALTNAQGAKCWGDNDRAMLGDGTTINRTSPVDVQGLSGGTIGLAASSSHTCAVTIGNGLKCWGQDGYGQLGLGVLHRQLTPVYVVDSVPAQIILNHDQGAPGSYLTLSGYNFEASSPVTIMINGEALTQTVTTNTTGGFVVFLNTTNSDPGGYFLSATGSSMATIPTAAAPLVAHTIFELDPGFPLYPKEGDGLELTVPPDIAVMFSRSYLPQVHR